MENYIGLSVPNLKGNELKYTIEAIETGWVSTAGPSVSKFEENIASYLGMEDAVACQSGTAGLHLAMLALGVQKNELVIVSTLTFIAAVNPISYVQASPVFMDCDSSLTMDPKKVRKYLEEECEKREDGVYDKSLDRKVSAMVVVHVFGNMADMEKLVNISKEYEIPIIEDATEALGTYYTKGRYEGKYAGCIGDIGVFSFNGNKIITTGGGGMVVSNNPEYLRHIRHLSTQAKADQLYFDHDEIGYNYRMGNVQASIGIGQLELLEDFIKIKNENYERYKENGLKLLEFRKGTRANKWFYSYVTDNRDELIEWLKQRKIQTRPIWKLIHTLEPYRECRAYEISCAEQYYEKILNIPCSTSLTAQEVDCVSEAIRNCEHEARE